MAEKQIWTDLDGMKVSVLKNWRITSLNTVDRILIGSTLGVNNVGFLVYDIDLFVPYIWSGSNWVTPSSIGSLLAFNNLSDLTDIVAARNNLGLGTLSTQNGTFSGISSGTNTGDQDLSPYLTIVGAAITYQPLITLGTALQYFKGDLTLGTFPINVSEFTNDAGYLTTEQIGYEKSATYADILPRIDDRWVRVDIDETNNDNKSLYLYTNGVGLEFIQTIA